MYSSNDKEHEQHVGQALPRQKQFGVNCNAEMCQFRVSEVGFLGFVMTPFGVGMEMERISTIEDWPTPQSGGDVQVLLGFTNCYRRFI